MTVGRGYGEAFAWMLGDLYADIELELWARIARKARISERDMAKLVAVADLRRDTARILTAHETAMVEEARRIISDAYQAGATATTVGTVSVINHATISALAADLTARLAATHLPILRHVEDIYRAVTAETTALVTAGTHTRREATQIALDRYAARGIRGFTDQAGRRWGIDTYAEMATRTAAGRASIAGGLDQYTAAGFDLFIVTDAPRECPLCTPWERQILTTTPARGGTAITTNLTTGQPIIVKIAGTVDQAIQAGLMHPNCRHIMNPYVPGATLTATEHAPETSPDLYRAGQQQRYLERQVRAWKRRDAIGNPDAAGRVRDYQAHIRAHLEDFPELKRLYYRETSPTGTSGRAIK